MQASSIGMIYLVWGILLFAVVTPIITYFVGKRWYCSWICGCGGLAETAGDPFRQLSSKKLSAWKLERWMIHGVLVFIVLVTAIMAIAATRATVGRNKRSLVLHKWCVLTSDSCLLTSDGCVTGKHL